MGSDPMPVGTDACCSSIAGPLAACAVLPHMRASQTGAMAPELQGPRSTQNCMPSSPACASPAADIVGSAFRLVWNVMGMMNNPHYRVMIHATQSASSLAMRFEHPTKSGSEQGGWMERKLGGVAQSQPGEADSGANIKKALDEAALKAYSPAEVSRLSPHCP